MPFPLMVSIECHSSPCLSSVFVSLTRQVHEKEVKMAVDEEQQRQTTQLTEAEIKRRVAISESLVAVHKELLSKREATKVS